MKIKNREILSIDQLDVVVGGSSSGAELLEREKPTGGALFSNVSKTRSEISMTFARNARA